MLRGAYQITSDPVSSMLCRGCRRRLEAINGIKTALNFFY